MRIYTRKGDSGETDLLGGIRVPKDHVRINAYGNVDELNAQLGLFRAVIEEATIDSLLAEIQTRLFEAGAELAGPDRTGATGRTIRSEDVDSLEKAIDRLESALPPLTHFVLPGGTDAACHAHVARCVCRRAERSVVRLLRSEPSETVVLRYLNRLSDLLFVLSRWANQQAGVPDVTWSDRPPTGNKENPGEPDPAS
jgi:cob(I)alamin adenosyltransferase